MATVKSSKEKRKASPSFSQKGLLSELDDSVLNRIAANIRKTRRSMREAEPLFERLGEIAEGKV